MYIYCRLFLKIVRFTEFLGYGKFLKVKIGCMFRLFD